MNIWEGLCLAYVILTKKEILDSDLYNFYTSTLILKLEVANNNLCDMWLSTWLSNPIHWLTLASHDNPKNRKGFFFSPPPSNHLCTSIPMPHIYIIILCIGTHGQRNFFPKNPSSTNMPYVQSYPPSNVHIVLIKLMTWDEPLKTDLGRFGMGPLRGLRKCCRSSMSSEWWPSLISMLVVHHSMCVAAQFCYNLVSGVTPHFL